MSSNSIDDILRIIRETVTDVANNEMKEEAKNIVSKHVNSDVYSYRPKGDYKRRRDNGGMSDKNNIRVDVKGKGSGIEMEIEETATGRNGFAYLDKVTEDGTGGRWNGSPPARPFMKNSAIELENKSVQALKKGLKNRGLKVE